MTERDFVDAMNMIKPTDALQDKIIETCKRYTEKKKRTGSIRRPFRIAAACFVAIALVVLGIPFIQQNVQTGETQIAWFDALSFKVKAGGLTVDLSKDVKTLIPTSNNFIINKKVVNGEKVDIITGMLAPDLSLSGKNIESVIYTAQNGILYSEFDSNDHDSHGNFIWSSSFALAPLNDYASWCQDSENPTKAELVKILNDLHAKRQLIAFYNVIYTNELAAMDGLRGSAWQEAYQAFEEKCSEPIDFNQYILSAEIDSSNLEITIINPAHPPIAPIKAKTITASAEDTVSWYIDGDSELGKQIFGHKRADVDFSQIRDSIEVKINYKNGHTESCTIHLQYTTAGELELQLKA